MAQYHNKPTVDLIDHMGSDLTVVNAARVSFRKHTQTFRPRDAKLIKYLAEHQHWSPFSHCFLSFRIEAPIFVARQLAKHQVGLAWNEVSRRYVDDAMEWFWPEYWRGRAADNKQGSSGMIKDQNDAYDEVEMAHVSATSHYNKLLQLGVAPEQARMVLPQTLMTEWYWSGSLAAFARVVNLRLGKDAQAETADVAAWIDTYCEELFPYSWDALTDIEYDFAKENEIADQ